MHAFISLFWFTVCVSVCVPSQAHLHTCVLRSEDKLRSWFSLPTMCVLGNKLSHQFQWQAPLPVSHLAGCLVMFVCVYDVCRKCRHASVSEYTCGGPRTTFGNQLSPWWIPETELKSSDLCGKHFYLLSRLAAPHSPPQSFCDRVSPWPGTCSMA